MTRKSTWKYFLLAATSLSVSTAYGGDTYTITGDGRPDPLQVLDINIATTTVNDTNSGTYYTIAPATGGNPVTSMTSSDTLTIDSTTNPGLVRFNDNGADATINVPITLTGVDSKLIFNPTATKTTTVNGVITSSAGTVQLNGPGTVDLQGESGTSFTSLIQVLDGQLKVSGNIGANIDLRQASDGLIVTGGLSSASLQNGKSVEFNKSSGTMTIGSVISNGSQNGEVGTITINAGGETGTVVFTGANTYTGATDVNAGTLKITSPGSLSGNINVDGTLELANTGPASDYSGNFSGSGTIKNSSSNKVILSGTPTFSGALETSAGSLELSNSWLSLNRNVTYSGTSTVILNDSSGTSVSPTNYTGNFTQSSGVGSLEKIGAGYVELSSGTNTITGTITITDGTLAISTGSLPAANISVASDKDLVIKTDTNTPKTFSNAISGSGDITINSGGALIWTGSSSGFSGAITLDDANTVLEVSEASMPAQVITLNNATSNLKVNLSSQDKVHGAVINGSGILTKLGSNKLTLTGNNTYSGGTTISDGTLEVETYLNGDYANSATMIVNMRTVDVPSSSVISGSGAVVKRGLYDWVVNAQQTFSGDLTIDGGTVSYGLADAFSSSSDVVINNTDDATLSLITSGTSYNGRLSSVSGSGTLALGSATLIVGNANDQEFSGSITSSNASSGALQKEGSGVWTLSGNNSGHIAASTINAGTILLGHASGLGSSSVTISGGSLDAYGKTVDNTISALSGTIKNTNTTAAVISSAVPLTGAATLEATSGDLTMSGLISGTQNITITGGSGKKVTTNAEVRVDGNFTISTADVEHTAKVIAFDGHNYNISSGSAKLTSTGTLSLAGSSFSIGTGTLTLDAATVSLDARHVGTQSTVSNATGGTVTLENTVVTSTSYGKQIEFALPVSGAGNLTKNDHGALKISGATTHTGATTVNGGSFILTDVAAASDDGAITLNRFSQFEIQASSIALVQRDLTGDGHFVKSGNANITMSGAMSHTGNVTVTGGNLIFSGPVTVGPQAVISAAYTAVGLEYQGLISPTGSSFDPLVDMTSTLTMNGANITTASIPGNSLAIGSSGYIMTLGTNGLDITAGKPTVLYSTLAGSGVLRKYGTSTLLLHNIGASYTGNMIVAAGTMIVNDNYANNSNIFVQTPGSLVFDIANDKESTKNITGATSSAFYKRGDGTLLIDGTGKIDGFAGNITLEQGHVQLRNTGLHSTSAVTVKSGASLDILRMSSVDTDKNIPSLTLNSRGTLRVIQENPANATYSKQITVGSLSGESGSVIVVQFDPSTGSASTPAASTAPLKITTLTTTNSNADRIFLQVRPTSKTQIVSDRVYAIIESNSNTTTAEMASRLRLMPSVMYGDDFVLTADGSSASSTRYGTLYYDSSALYVRMNASGHYAAAISGDPASTSIPANAYLYTFLGDLMNHGDIPWYSALDQFMTSQLISGSRDWAMLSPQSHIALNQAFSQGSLFVDHHVQKGFASAGQQSYVQHMLDRSSLSVQLRQALHQQSDQHLNLSQDTRYQEKGQWKGWTHKFSLAGLTSNNLYQQNVSGSIIGAGYSLGQYAVSSQFADLDQSYEEISGLSQGNIHSQISQGHVVSWSGPVQLQSQVTAGHHHISHERTLDVDLGEGYVKSWSASSQQSAYEAKVQQQAVYHHTLNNQLSVQSGVSYQGQYVAYSGYTEEGAENLNLEVKPYTTQTHVVHPTIGLGFNQVHNNHWISAQYTIGYEYHQAYRDAMQFGFQEYSAQCPVSSSLDAKSAYTMGWNVQCGSVEGLSLMASTQLSYEGRQAPIQYQNNVSLVWSF